MAALTGAKGITQKGADFIGPLLVAANAIIYHGALVTRSATGYAKAAAPGDNAVIGVADLNQWNDQQDINGQATQLVNLSNTVINNTGGADGAREVLCRCGVFAFENKGGDAVTATLIGTNVYVEDDQTVRATATGSIVAGTLMGFDPKTGKPLVLVGNRYGKAV